jgi:serine/threonine protein kinase
VVLYEMLTGRRPFEGEDVAEVMASVIHKDPDLTGLPPAVGSVVERCLRKDPRRRMRDIGDVRMALEEAPAQTQAAAPHSKPAWIPWTVAGALILAVLSLTAALYRATRPAPLRPLIRVNVDLPEDTPLARSANGGMLTLSPDGTRERSIPVLFSRRPMARLLRRRQNEKNLGGGRPGRRFVRCTQWKRSQLG